MTEAETKIAEATRMLYEDLTLAFGFTDKRAIHLIAMSVQNLVKVMIQNSQAIPRE